MQSSLMYSIYESSPQILLRRFAALLSARTDDSSVCHLNLLIVSREFTDFIPELLSSFPRISLDPDADTEINQDIDLFIKAKVNQLSRSRQYPESLRVHVIDVFRDRAQGTFLWIGIVARALRKYKATEVEEALDLFPKGLDELYARMLLQIDSDRREIAAKILRWVVMAFRPLTLSELSIAIETIVRPSAAAFSRDKMTRDQVSNCRYFLKIQEDEVGLIHQSAKDYLLRKTRDSNPELETFRIKEEAANLEIARKCLNYLHSGALENSVSDVLENTSHLRAFPLLKYAALHWHEHARFLDRSEDIFDLSLPFYQKKSHIRRSWLEAYRDYFHKYSLCPYVSKSFNLLHFASYFGILPLAEKLVLAKGLMDKTKRLYYLRKHDYYGMTALMWAANRGHEAVVRLLLKKGANIEAKDQFGETELMGVLETEGYKTIVPLLLEKGADVNAKNKYGQTALMKAAGFDLPLMMRLLLEKGADVNVKDKDGMTVLMIVTRWISSRLAKTLIRLLLEKGADIEAKDKHGETALIKAAANFNERTAETLVRLLLEKGPDIKAQDKYGTTALMPAVSFQNKDVIRLLLKEGADINAQDGYGETALMIAARRGDERTAETMIRLLLEKGADINTQDTLGQTALMKAAGNRHEGIAEALVRLLLENGQILTLRIDIGRQR